MTLKKPDPRPVFVLVLMGWLLTSVPAPAAAQVGTRYLQAARVNLRMAASTTSASLALLPINTPLKLLGEAGSWCQVETLRVSDATLSAAPGPINTGAIGTKGYVLCNVLALQPNTLAQVDMQLADDKLSPARLIDFRSRAFWLAPSLTRWAAFGTALEQNLTEAQRYRSAETGAGPIRPRSAEFDAMKALLAKGTVTPAVPSAAVATAAAVNPATPVTGQGGTGQGGRVVLPEAKPSFFNRTNFQTLLPSGWIENGGGQNPTPDETGKTALSWGIDGDQFAMLDDLAARVNARITVTVTGESYYDRGDSLVGVWDVGALQLALSNPVQIATVRPNGQVTALAAQTLQYAIGGNSCIGSGALSITAPARPKGVRGMGDFLLAWVGRMPPTSQVQVTSRQLNGKTMWDKLLVHQVDVDGDGHADFLVQEGRYKPQISALGLWKTVHVNIAGSWHLVYSAQDADCT